MPVRLRCDFPLRPGRSLTRSCSLGTPTPSSVGGTCLVAKRNGWRMRLSLRSGPCAHLPCPCEGIPRLKQCSGRSQAAVDGTSWLRRRTSSCRTHVRTPSGNVDGGTGHSRARCTPTPWGHVSPQWATQWYAGGGRRGRPQRRRPAAECVTANASQPECVRPPAGQKGAPDPHERARR